MNTFVKSNPKRIRKEKVLTGIIPDNAGYMIHNSRSKFIDLSSKKVAH